MPFYYLFLLGDVYKELTFFIFEPVIKEYLSYLKSPIPESSVNAPFSYYSNPYSYFYLFLITFNSLKSVISNT